jgi:alkylated DNA repair dioxygenase AlkB
MPEELRPLCPKDDDLTAFDERLMIEDFSAQFSVRSCHSSSLPPPVPSTLDASWRSIPVPVVLRGCHGNPDPHLSSMSSTKSAPQNIGQADLFGLSVETPEGFRYQPDFITVDEEARLLHELESLPFQPFDFHGHLANRRVIGFGLRYDYDRRRLVNAPPVPDFLLPLRAKVAAFAEKSAESFAQVLINEYRPGAGIGWHRDKPHFADIAGVSLLAACDFRLRGKTEKGWDRKTILVEGRSAYLLTGPVRADWEHSIPPVSAHRYSITFRTMRFANCYGHPPTQR